MHSINIFADSKCQLGECPLWDDRRQGLYWLDILSRELFFKGIESTANTIVWNLPCLCSAIFLIEDDDRALLCVSADGLGVFRLDTSDWLLIASSGYESETCRSNDAGLDPVGRLWYGTMNADPVKNAGCIYRWQRGQSFAELVKVGVHIPNTFVWNGAGDYFFSADSFKSQIFRMHYDLQTGNAVPDRILVDLSGTGFEPDGSCMDSADRLWNAQWNGSRIACYDIEGELLEKILIPVTRPTSCCFGGENLDKLFVTSARTGIDEDALQVQPYAGGIFSIDLPCRGLPARRIRL